MVQLPIYLDNNATTRPDPRVIEAMLPTLTEVYGNAASGIHGFGRQASVAVENARQEIACCLHAASPREIVFLSGATESDNLAIKGVAESYGGEKNHIITVKTEHKAVLDSCAHLERQGFEVTYLGVDTDGLLDLNALEAAMTDKTLLVTVMAGNNEIGVVQDIAAIGGLCRQRGVLFHSDATQMIGKLPFDVQNLPVDLVSFTAHKIYGPKGAGALWIRKTPVHDREGKDGVSLCSQIDGGGHEGGCRSGTLNVPGIVGLATALRLCHEEITAETARLIGLRERMLQGLRAQLEDVFVNGHVTKRLPGHLSLSFCGVVGAELLTRLPEIAISSVSACSSSRGGTSHVLDALKIGQDRIRGTVRIGIGRFNTQEEIEYAVERIAEQVKVLRSRPSRPSLFGSPME